MFSRSLYTGSSSAVYLLTHDLHVQLSCDISLFGAGLSQTPRSPDVFATTHSKRAVNGILAILFSGLWISQPLLYIGEDMAAFP